MELKSVRRSSSDLQCQLGLLPNDRDGMSAIAMLFPATCIDVNGHAFCCFTRKANAWIRCSATLERFDASFVVQLMDGELSFSNVICFSSKGLQTSSMVSQRRTIPAISKSEFVMFPPGLFSVFMSVVTSSGHCHQKIVGTQGDSSPMTTPPAP